MTSAREPASVVAARQLAAEAHERRRMLSRSAPSRADTARIRRASHLRPVRVLIAGDEPFLADAIRDGLRLEVIAADVVQDGGSTLENSAVNSYDVVVLARDLPGTSGGEVARRMVADGRRSRILVLTAADRLEEAVAGFGLGADGYLTKPFAMPRLLVRLRALGRRRVDGAPPVVEFAGLTLRQRRTDHRFLLAQAPGRPVAHPHRSRQRLPGGGADERPRHERRRPPVSARLRLTLSDAGFLLVAGPARVAVLVSVVRFVLAGVAAAIFVLRVLALQRHWRGPRARGPRLGR